MPICINISESRILLFDSKLVTSFYTWPDLKLLFFWRILTFRCTNLQPGGWRTQYREKICWRDRKWWEVGLMKSPGASAELLLSLHTCPFYLIFIFCNCFRISNINWGERYGVLNFTHLHKSFILTMVNIYYPSSPHPFMKVFDIASSPVIHI